MARFLMPGTPVFRGYVPLLFHDRFGAGIFQQLPGCRRLDFDPWVDQELKCLIQDLLDQFITEQVILGCIFITLPRPRQ